MHKVINDPNNDRHFKITKQDIPVFVLSLDLKGATKGQLNIVTEYIPQDEYELMTTIPNRDGDGKILSYGTVHTRLEPGKFELGYESGVNVPKLKEALDPNVPHVHIPSFLSRICCEYDEGSLVTCIGMILDFSLQIINHGVQNDAVMGHRNYALNIRSLNSIDLVTSGKVPVTAAKNAIPTLDHSYKIIDIYKKTQRPLTKLIKRAYLLPPKNHEMHVFNNGVAKLRKLSDQQIMLNNKKIKESYINWPTMQKIRLKQKSIAKVIKRPLHKKK